MSCSCKVPPPEYFEKFKGTIMRGFEGWCFGHQVMHERTGLRAPCICGEHDKVRQLRFNL